MGLRVAPDGERELTQDWLGGGNVQKMVQEIIQQAGQFGADAVIDIKVVGSGGDHSTVVMTGTAVRLL